jgi:flagellar hook assembly protein FlgD
MQNHPNPFNPTTSIAYSIKERGHVLLSIYDVNGALVRTLTNETRAAGAQSATWDGRDDEGRSVASGVYFYKLTGGKLHADEEEVLLK